MSTTRPNIGICVVDRHFLPQRRLSRARQLHLVLHLPLPLHLRLLPHLPRKQPRSLLKRV